MGRIKILINELLTEDKELISAFVLDNITYVVINSDKTGSMGLPIIWISKLNASVLHKVEDDFEWKKVKENLKLIIGNSPMQYVNLPAEVSATDNYYTQLTLPQDSFQALKNNYSPVALQPSAAPVVPVAPATFVPNIEVTPLTATPVVQPVVPPMPAVAPAQVSLLDAALQQAPVTVAPVIEPVAVAPISSPVIEPVVVTPVAPVIPEPQAINVAAVPAQSVVMPADFEEVVVTPTVALDSAPVTNVSAPVNTDELKESFLKACENIFDGLVQQLNK